MNDQNFGGKPGGGNEKPVLDGDVSKDDSKKKWTKDQKLSSIEHIDENWLQTKKKVRESDGIIKHTFWS